MVMGKYYLCNFGSSTPRTLNRQYIIVTSVILLIYTLKTGEDSTRKLRLRNLFNAITGRFRNNKIIYSTWSSLVRLDNKHWSTAFKTLDGAPLFNCGRKFSSPSSLSSTSVISMSPSGVECCNPLVNRSSRWEFETPSRSWRSTSANFSKFAAFSNLAYMDRRLKIFKSTMKFGIGFRQTRCE
ncbi:hypothetical protein M514_06340 [Trichuris suis]|uniref:Uncharacterized protein n=1 Tax=Trichuris suis TaxID=68888 RepID=A0A085MUB8_9BILA|nr:hypothetical protein M513_06340 [Trichuris suis]KFD60814.1 hypothetical protein M514_06340 [Trichuris suis]